MPKLFDLIGMAFTGFSEQQKGALPTREI